MPVRRRARGNRQALAAIAVVAMLWSVGMFAPPSASAAVSSIDGTVTSGTGPLAGITVTAVNWLYGNAMASTTTDASGNYSIVLPAGSKAKVRFTDATSTWATAYNGGASSFGTAATITLPASGPVVANVTMLSFKGTIGGVVTDAGSAPAPDISVKIYNCHYGNQVATTTTDESGAYSVGGLNPGSYKVGFFDATTTYATTWNGGAASMKSASAVIVSSHTTTTVSVTVHLPGSLSGTLTAGTSGMPLANVLAIVFTTTPLSPIAAGVTNSSGAYNVTGLAPGNYKILFADPVYLNDQTKGLRPLVFDGVDGITNGLNSFVLGTAATITSSSTTVADDSLVGIDCTMAPGANLASANLANKNLTGCDLSNVDLTSANLTGANLRGARLNGATVAGTNLAGTNLYRVRSGGLIGSPSALPAGWMLGSGHLIGPGADLTDATLSALNLTGIDLSNATLTNLASSGITGTPTLAPAWMLVGGHLMGPTANLSGVNLSGIDLTGVDLTGANMSGVASGGTTGTPTALPTFWFMLSGYVIGPGANLAGANLAGANLNLANLTNASLIGADLSGANLSDAGLESANLTSANLTGANLNFAFLGNATGPGNGTAALATWGIRTICYTYLQAFTYGGTCVGVGPGW